MIFGAGRAISLARILIALAGKLVTAADAITIAGFGSRFDGNKSHGISPSKHSMRDSAGRRGFVTRRSTRCDQEKWARLFRFIGSVARGCQFPKFFRWARRKGEPKLSRSSCQCGSAMPRKTETLFGSNWVTAQ